MANQWFVRVTESTKGAKALEYLRSKSTSIFCCYEDREVENGTPVNPHWHMFVETTVGEKEIRKQVNGMGVKGNEMWSFKKWDPEKTGMLYMCKGASENDSPVIVHNNVKTDEEVALLHTTFWKNREEFRPKKKARTLTWSQQVIVDITTEFKTKVHYEKIDLARRVLYAFRGSFRPYKRRLAQEMLETIIFVLEGASEEHLEFNARNLVQNIYDTRT